MTEKRDLNNELILMKKTIQQAKVCVIRKLVRKLNNISNPQGKEVTGLKLIGKKSRLTDQIKYLKKTPNLHLASLALTFEKNPSKILTNNLSTIEDVSLANIVTFKAVLAKVNEIKSKFCLNESDDDWRERVREIGKKKKKEIEKERNRSRNKERKERHKKQSELVKMRDEWLIENNETNEETVRNFDSEEDEHQEPSDKSQNSKKTSKIVDSGTKMKALPKKKPINEPKKIVDSFFITETGDSYLATKVIERVQPSGPSDGLDRKERRAQQFGSKPKTNPKRQDIPAMSKSRTLIKSVNNDDDDLHPSWAAKIKAKGIDKFQGKKTKFSDEAPAVVVGKATQNSQNESEKIHPSWAAKQKLKPVISEFKGNKIVFDD